MPKFDGKKQLLEFDNKEQYDLFMLYLNTSKIIAMRDVSADQSLFLADFYLQDNDLQKFEVTLHHKWGTEGVVSKFMEVTGMMKMDYTKYMPTNYKPDEQSSAIPLARQGDATIDAEVLIKMQQYKQNHAEKQTKPA